jgi:N-acetylglutamate synthase-like GNAT family acetyltransferase
VTIEPAAASDLDAIKALLHMARLPTDDLTEALLANFLVAREADAIVGVVGIEHHGAMALLRSLVVQESSRREGLGARLLDAAESLARSSSVRSLYLLTTTADKFFAARGYRRLARDEAPAEISATTQFSALCPATAVLMVKP